MRNEPQTTTTTTTTASPRPARPGLRHAFSSLRYRSFRLLWTSTLFTSAGVWIQQVTIGWLALDLTGSAFQVGAITGMRGLPMLVLGPVGGVVADRIDRRKLLLFTQVFLVILAVTFSIPAAFGWVAIWHLYAFSLLTGIGWAFQNPVRQSLVANSVPHHALMNAVALNSMAFNSTRIVGPAIGGGIIVLMGAGPNFLLQAGAYVAVFILVLFYRPLTISDRSAARRESLFHNLQSGFSYVVHHSVLRALMLNSTVTFLFLLAFSAALMPVYAHRVVDAGATGLGLLLAASGVGGFMGTLLLASMGNVRRTGLLIVGSTVAAGVATIGFGLVDVMWIAVPIITLAGGLQMLNMATTNTAIQAIVPDELRGRVMGIYMLTIGTMPAGAVLAGALAQTFTVTIAFIAGGATAIALSITIALSVKGLRRLE
jgi:MFS family permease